MLNVVLYAGVFGLIFVGLSVRTLLLRRRLKIAVGDGTDPLMLRATRAHGNFAEYVPFALFLIFLLETQVGYSVLIHILGCALITGRVAHAYGVSQLKEDFRLRVFGMACTFFVVLGASLRLIAAWLGM